ncbi:MAG: hypothetical protein ACR2QW_05405 [bacterium]
MTIASREAIFGKPPEKPMATVKALQAKLTKLGVDYKSKATKAELEVLVLNATRKSPPEKREAKPRAETVRADIKITCMVETVDGSVHEMEFTIVNPSGCIRPDQINKADTIFDVLHKGLTSRLGVKHIRT